MSYAKVSRKYQGGKCNASVAMEIDLCVMYAGDMEFLSKYIPTIYCVCVYNLQKSFHYYLMFMINKHP